MANNADLLAHLRSSVPETNYAFAEAWALSPDLNPLAAAQAVGLAPQEAHKLARDRRTLQVLYAHLAGDSSSLRAVRESCIRMIGYIAHADPAAAFQENGLPLSLHQIPPEARVAIKTIELHPDGVTIKKIGWYDRLEALKLLLAHFGELEAGGVADGGAARVVFRGRGQLEDEAAR